MTLLARRPPGVLVIDLDRLPSLGKDIGLAIRARRSTRGIPLVFVGGLRPKVGSIRRLLPDARFARWSRAPSAIHQALEHLLENPVAPRSLFDQYSTVPLSRKLGIKPGMRIELLAAPRGIARMLGDLPPEIDLRHGTTPTAGLTLWFVRSRQELSEGIRTTRARERKGPTWIIWPKRASGVSTDLTQRFVRGAGLRAGFVDYKICSIDATWSGLLFRHRGRA